MYQIAIVDDEAEFTEKVKEEVSKFFVTHKLRGAFTLYTHPSELLADIEAGKYFDLYFLDLEMPEVSGMMLAQAVRKRYTRPYIIFVTSYEEYALPCYRYNALGYIMKDKLKLMIPRTLRAWQEALSRIKDRYYIMNIPEELYRLNYNIIYRIFRENKNVYFHTIYGRFHERKSLKEAYDILNCNDFMYTDQSNIVNIRHIVKFKEDSVRVRGAGDVHVSANHMRELKEAVIDYWSKRQDDPWRINTNF